VIVKTALAVTN